MSSWYTYQKGLCVLVVFVIKQEECMKMSVLDAMTPQYIVDGAGKKTSVVLDLKTFSLIIEELEDLQDIREAEKILAKGKKEYGRTLEEIKKSLRKKD